MLKNEDGFILPLMLGIFLVTATLLLMLSSQLEIKAASYLRTQDYLRLNILEQEGMMLLEEMLANIEMTDDMVPIYERFALGRSGVFEVNISFLQEKLEINYQIVYNEFVRERRLMYRFNGGIIFLE